MNIYLSGAISSDPNYKEKFEKIEQLIKQEYPTVNIVNPVTITQHLDPKINTWNEYMIVCIEHLIKCDMLVYIQDGFESKGRDLELMIANELGILIVFRGVE